MIFIDPNLPLSDRKHQLLDLHEKMASLLKSPAWKFFDDYLRGEESNAFQIMSTASVGDLAMKAIGAYTAIKNTRELPAKTLDWVQKALQSPEFTGKTPR